MEAVSQEVSATPANNADDSVVPEASRNVCDTDGLYLETEMSSAENLNLQNSKGKATNANVCSICSYSAPCNSKLVIHTRKHTGEKPYKCDTCSYAAAQKYSLDVHTRKHTGEKPFKCDM